MTYQLPDRRLLVHKAVDIEKLSAKNAPVLRDGLPCEATYRWERKYDGCSVIVVVDDNCDVTYWSRDGKPCTSLGHLTNNLERLPARTVLFGEAWRPEAEFREISGEFRRKAVQPQLRLVVFDTVPLDDFEAGHSKMAYAIRSRAASDLVSRAGHPYIWTANTCLPHQVSDLAAHPTDAYDGAVAKRWDGHWTAGAGLGGEVLKVKNIVDVDLEVIGVEEGQGKHAGRLGAIVCRYEGGVELRVGTGFADLERDLFWENKQHIVGKVVRVLAMKDSGKGSLREPRYKGIRHDKTEPDY